MMSSSGSQFTLSGAGLLEAAAMLLVFVGVLFAGSILLTGRRVEGSILEGKSITYKLNGLALFLLTAAIGLIAQIFGWFSLSALYTHFVELFVVANVFAFVFSGWLCWRGVLTRGGPGGILRGYFFGVELNPSLLGVDLKFFSYRPSLIGLALFNASFAVVQYEAYGELTLAMTLYQIFTFLYVLNYFQFEDGMIHTWDIVSERFGWMLVWGDYVLVPFFYCLPGWWLVHATEPLSAVAAALIVLLFVFGFWLFRGANQQKHRFKSDPGATIWGRPPQTLDGRLLVSGFWGVGRHLNYTGEICVYLSFALTTGFASWVPYVLPAWLASLLWHRSRRDDRRCRAKYGELWERYTQRVRYSMLPFIY
ncbi:MAG: DUF1295 domain-containing protein [Gammaproteobacteria bacterium]|nr:DUF1295 domain-containing protein [Gammaproteobacteria bacterium]MYG67270.1 DUF1295 domain-containing protein [Gammaproteobacteria bacterium]MYH91386.1 DUF1295 domain-containing protein [Gammaproteobacteria bacterium]